MTDEFWDVVCAAGPALRVALTGVFVLLLLSLFALLFISPGSGSYYLTLANLLILIPLMGVLVYSIRRCGQLRDVDVD